MEVLLRQVTAESRFEAADAQNESSYAVIDPILRPFDGFVVGTDRVPERIVHVEILVGDAIPFIDPPGRVATVVTDLSVRMGMKLAASWQRDIDM